MFAFSHAFPAAAALTTEERFGVAAHIMDRDRWVEKLRCPNCRKAGIARLSATDEFSWEIRMVSRKALRLFGQNPAATFTAPRAIGQWNHRRSKAVSLRANRHRRQAFTQLGRRCARGHFLQFRPRPRTPDFARYDRISCSEASSARSPGAPLRCSEFSCSTGTSSSGSQGWWAVI